MFHPFSEMNSTDCTFLPWWCWCPPHWITPTLFVFWSRGTNAGTTSQLFPWSFSTNNCKRKCRDILKHNKKKVLGGCMSIALARVRRSQMKCESVVGHFRKDVRIIPHGGNFCHSERWEKTLFLIINSKYIRASKGGRVRGFLYFLFGGGVVFWNEPIL